jgi:hypothetical protein
MNYNCNIFNLKLSLIPESGSVYLSSVTYFGFLKIIPEPTPNNTQKHFFIMDWNGVWDFILVPMVCSSPMYVSIPYQFSLSSSTVLSTKLCPCSVPKFIFPSLTLLLTVELEFFRLYPHPRHRNPDAFYKDW